MATYSTSPEGQRKAALDLAILGKDGLGGLTLDNEAYLKRLIREVSRGRVEVSSGARGLQFFIVKGGGEGFLDAAYEKKDASRVTVGGATTSGVKGTEIVFDDNDLLAAFTAGGTLIAAALLRRPLSIKHPSIWSEHTANTVYNAWDGQSVSLYRNTNFEIQYYGLRVNDKLGYYSSGRVRIDLHKEEATNGCIFIRDPNSPPISEPHKLNRFEPAFIVRIQEAIGAKTGFHIGTIRVVSI